MRGFLFALAIVIGTRAWGLDPKVAVTQLARLRVSVQDNGPGRSAGCREQCLEAGMDDFVGKPVAMEALFEALGRWAPVKEPAPGAPGLAQLSGAAVS